MMPTCAVVLSGATKQEPKLVRQGVRANLMGQNGSALTGCASAATASGRGSGLAWRPSLLPSRWDLYVMQLWTLRETLHVVAIGLLALNLCHCRQSYTSGIEDAQQRVAETDSVSNPDAEVTSTPAKDPDIDAGPLTPVAFVSPPGRSGFVSPVLAQKSCLAPAQDGIGVGIIACSAAAPTFALGFERLVVAGKCVTTTRPVVNAESLRVTLMPCDGANPNQRFGYKSGTFFWGQNPNRCLDTSEVNAQDGSLIARICDGGGNQTFVMHSALSDKQPALRMGPDNAFMPFGNGFLGSDAGATAALDFNRTIFLFNDTFGNKEGGASRSNIDAFVHNTVGVMACDDLTNTKNCVIKYYFGGQQSFTTAIFEDPNASFYFWPATGTLYDGSLYVVNERTVSSNQGLGFSSVGTMVARITNPQDTPDLWDKQQFDVSHNPNVFIVTQIWQRQTPTGSWAPSADDGNYAYYYFHTDTGMPLLRLPFARMADANAYLFDGASAWQYLSKQNTWRAWPVGGHEPSDYLAASPDSSLGNINYDAATHTYYFIGQSPNLYLETGTYFSTSKSASGPWPAGKLLYAPPQYDSKSAAYINGAVCYASESHPEMAPAGMVAFTYQCGTDPNNTGTYRQNLIRVPNPW